MIWIAAKFIPWCAWFLSSDFFALVQTAVIESSSKLIGTYQNFTFAQWSATACRGFATNKTLWPNTRPMFCVIGQVSLPGVTWCRHMPVLYIITEPLRQSLWWWRVQKHINGTMRDQWMVMYTPLIPIVLYNANQIYTKMGVDLVHLMTKNIACVIVVH